MFGQTASLRRVTGAYSSDSTPVYSAAVSIAVAFQEGTQRAVTSGGEVLTAPSRTLFTGVECGLGDEVTFASHIYHVAGISTTPTLDGAILLWEVVLE
jgi:hypothetical protein